MSLSIQLFGGFQIRDATGQPIALPQPRLQLLLAYLLLRGQSDQLRSHLAFQFWPDSTEKQARTNLRKLLHTLRGVLPQVEAHLDMTTETIRWQASAACILDVAEFEAGLEQAALATRAEVKRRCMVAALDSYQGDLLPGHYDDWVLVERERLHLRYVNGLAHLAKLHEAAGDLEAALDCAQRLLRADPLQETTYCLLIRLHLESGEPARALRAYHRCASLLAEELGVEPGDEIQLLHGQILRAEKRTSGPVRTPQTTPRRVVPLVGRSAEWQQLRRIWQTVHHGGSRLVVIQGEPGIGKTRLAEEMVELARRQGYSTLYARAYAAEGRAAYGPVADLLRSEESLRAIRRLDALWQEELARILPELVQEQSPAPTPMTESWQQRRFHEALVRGCLAAGQPQLLHLDDLQWFDPESLSWLHFLLRFAADAKLLVVGTLRTTEVDPKHPYVDFRNAYLQNGEFHEIALDALSTEAVEELTRAVVDRKLDDQTLDGLYRITEGNPLFVLEALRGVKNDDPSEHASDSGKSNQTETAVVWPELTPKVQAVIQARLAQLSPVAQHVIRIAAVIGRQFTFDLLYAVRAGMNPGSTHGAEIELVDALDELWQRRIIREHGSQAYDFGHDRIRETVYAEIGPVLRPHLHSRVATTLEALYTTDLGSVSSQIANHFEAAGKNQQAVTHYLSAVRYAKERYAHEEAVRNIKHALTLLPPTDLLVQYELHMLLEEIFRLAGTPEERYKNVLVLDRLARQLEREASTSTFDSPAHKAALARRAAVSVSLSNIYSNMSRIDDAFASGHEAVRLAEAGDAQVELARAHNSLGWSCYWKVGDMASAHRELTRAAELASRLGMEQFEAVCLEQIAATGMYSGLSAKKIMTYMHRIYAIYEKTGDLLNLAGVHNKYGYIVLAQGDSNHEDAIRHYRRGLEIVRQIGATGLEYNICNNLGMTYMAVGDYRRAEQYLMMMRGSSEHIDHLFRAINSSFVAELRANQGRLKEAAACHQSALELFEKSRGEHRKTETISHLGYVLYLQEDYAAALDRLQSALAMARDRGDRRFEATAQVRLGHVYLALDRVSEAERAYTQAYELRLSMEQNRRAFEALIGLAHIAWLANRTDAACASVSSVYDELIRCHLDYTAEGFQVYASCYRLLSAMDDPRAPEIYRLAQAHLAVRNDALEDEAAQRIFHAMPLHQLLNSHTDVLRLVH